MRLGYTSPDGTVTTDLGLIADMGNGCYAVFPNPKAADLWAKVTANVVDTDTFLLQMTGIGRVGAKPQAHGHINARFGKNKDFGASVGVNHNFVNQNSNAYIHFCKDFDDAWTIFATAAMMHNAEQNNTNRVYYLGVKKLGKMGFFTRYERNSVTKEPTVNLGTTISLSHSRRIGKDK